MSETPRQRGRTDPAHAGEPTEYSRAMSSSSAFIPVIPAGGSGTRLWPLSRKGHPKFLLDLTGSGSSLLQQTLDRLEPIADHPPIVVTGAAHADAVRDQVGERASILAEPSAKNSMPAIAWAAAVAERIDPDAVIGSFAADHLIADTGAFHTAIRSAIAAAELGYLVTLGIEPDYPATGFGYIEAAQDTPAELAQAGARAVARFVEKPDRETAEQFLATGRFAWNGGMFLARARTILDALEQRLPQTARAARTLADADPEAPADASAWEEMTAIAIDHALAEPMAAAGEVAMVPAAFDWDDVGDFRALGQQLRAAHTPAYRLQEHGSDVVALHELPLIAQDAHASVLSTTGRLVALLGVQGVSVVDTPDALLVIADERAQDLSGLVKRLSEKGLANSQ